MLRLIRFIGLLLFVACAVHAELPSCRVVAGASGPAILINNQPFSPIFFGATNRFNRDDVLVEELKLAAGAEIRLFSYDIPMAWDGPSEAAAVIDKFCSAHPNGYFYVRVRLDGSKQWLEQHRDAAMVDSNGAALPWASPASTVWREDAARLLRECLQEIEAGPHASRFIGVCLVGLSNGEWSYPESNSFLDYSDANVQAFRAWLKKQYVNDKGLRRAWNQDAVSIKTAIVPAGDLRDAAQWGPFRDAMLHRPVMDYQRFLNENVAEAIAQFAAVVKKVTHGKSLVGASHGYTLEAGVNGPRALAHSGHLALAQVLECEDINLIHAPYSYVERELGRPSHLPVPADSIALHGKLLVMDDDSRTYTAQPVPEGSLAVGNVTVAATLEELLSINRRNIASFLTHRAGMSYVDALSDGRWNDKKFWESAAITRRLFAEARTPEPFAPQVAFVVSEDSVHTLRATTLPYQNESLSQWRLELDRLGAPVGYYLQSDLPRLADSVRVLILANAYSIALPERKALDRFLGKGGTVVWTFAPDVYGEGGASVARISDAIGMQVSTRDRDGAVTLKSAVTEDAWQLGEDWELRFEVATKENVHAIALYEGTESVAAAATPYKGGISVYTAYPRLPIGVLRWIGANSGVHFYSDTPQMTGLFGPYFVVHTDAESVHTFHWPAKVKSVERIIPRVNYPLATDADAWMDQLPAKTTAIYRITP